MAQTHITHGACELKNKLARLLLVSALLVFAVTAAAQQPTDHPPTAVPAPAGSAYALENTGERRRDLAVSAVGREGGQEHAAEEGGHHDESIGGMILGMGWPVANFIIFVGVLYYFLNKPFREYLATRSSTIRKDLVEAAELRSSANEQLAKIEARLQALPGELNALRTRGAEEIKAEEQRIAEQAAADRDRLLDQTRREIDLQVRLAKKEILEHAANLSVQLATERIKQEVTPEDQERLIDRYLSQVKEQH